METQCPSFGWLGPTSQWTKEDNKKFENALAMTCDKDPQRWLKVATFVPGKTVQDVIKQYLELLEDVNNIEAGKVPFPGYLPSSMKLQLSELDRYKRGSLACKVIDSERRKGVPWTEDEHRRFLMGLVHHGKGDWRNIARNFVLTKTHTQVASHAQKYFIRQQLCGSKNKRRPSIHDITTLSLLSEAKHRWKR